jgi:N,N'-diacetyllegionaminate synthase
MHGKCSRLRIDPSARSQTMLRPTRDEYTRETRVPDVNRLSIAGREVGPGCPALIIAEVAQAHDGSLGMAHAFIDAVGDAGADAVKFQTHIAAAESTLDEPFRVRFSQQDQTRYHYWTRMEFTPDEWRELAAHAEKRGLVFLSSPFSVAGVDLLRGLGMLAWKIGSGEFASADLWKAMAETGAPILFSTGMAKRAEIADAVASFRSMNLPYALMQCTSAYPTPLEAVGLNVLDELRREFDCPVGLSDHSGSMFPGLAALARGANLLEVHVTFDRRMFSPDTAASLTFDELKIVCQMRDALSRMDAHPVDKDAMAEQLLGMREIFGKSLAPVRPLAAGTVLRPEMMVSKKPGGGIPLEAAGRISGRRLARDVAPDRILRWTDLVEE